MPPFHAGMKPYLHDLFGEIPVLQSDLDLWLDVVVKMPRSSWRRDHYAASWNVPEKIRRAKAAGEWPEIEKARTERLRALGIAAECVTSSPSP